MKFMLRHYTLDTLHYIEPLSRPCNKFNPAGEYLSGTRVVEKSFAVKVEHD